MIRSIFLGAGLFIFSAALAKADTRLWTGTTSNNISDYRNYNPAAGTIDQDLVFDKPALDLQMLASLSPNSLHIKSSASGFKVTDQSYAYELLIRDRLTVDAGTVATFDVKLGVRKGVANSVLTLDVGINGRLNILGPLALFSADGAVYKKGDGTLYIGTSSSSSLAGVSLHLDEGTTILKGGSVLGTPTSGVNGQVTTTVGSATESSTLSVEFVSGKFARIHGTLQTAGVTQSRIEVNGEFRATTLDLSEGATLQFDLQAMNSFFNGTTLTLEDVVNIELLGAEIGESYNLFRFTTVEGFDASLFNVVGIDPALTLWSLNNGTVSVQVIPESGVLSLSFIGLSAVAAFGWRRKKSAATVEG